MARPIAVVCGNLAAGTTERGLANGFRELGWLVQEVQHPQPRGGSLPTRIARRLTRKSSAADYERNLLKECTDLRPEYVITVKGVDISSSTLQKIKSIGTITVMYYPDFHFSHTGVDVETFTEYDAFITTKSFQVEHLKSRLGIKSVHFVHHGYCPDVHEPVQTRSTVPLNAVPLLYSGTHSNQKQVWIEEVLARCPDVDLYIVGGRWKGVIPETRARNCHLLGPRMGLSYAQSIGAAKINLAVHFGASKEGWADLVSTRTFEIPACRGFMLHIDNEEVRELFEPGKEIDTFATPEELADKIRFYLPREELRQRMVDQAFKRCVPHYSYSARAAEIAEILGET